MIANSFPKYLDYEFVAKDGPFLSYLDSGMKLEDCELTSASISRVVKSIG